jgi:hypothetical protein
VRERDKEKEGGSSMKVGFPRHTDGVDRGGGFTSDYQKRPSMRAVIAEKRHIMCAIRGGRETESEDADPDSRDNHLQKGEREEEGERVCKSRPLGTDKSLGQRDSQGVPLSAWSDPSAQRSCPGGNERERGDSPGGERCRPRWRAFHFQRCSLIA